MADFEYQSLKEHLNETGLFYRLVVDSVLQAAQEGGMEDSIDVYPEDLPDGFDFLRDRELIAEMLAERPEVDFVEHHNNGFCLQLREPVMTTAELAFAAQMQRIDGVDMDNLGSWLEHARSLADADAETIVASTDECYHKLLGDFGSVFQEMEQTYTGAAAAIFNYKPDYLPNELLPAADWICNSGAAEEAYAMAQEGAFELKTFVAREPKAITQTDLEAMHARHILWELGQPDGVCADFEGLRLDGLRFECMVFTGGSFAGVVIENCDLSECIFDGCNFQDALLRDVSAYNAEFGGAAFDGASLTNCGFKRASLQEASFAGTVIVGCDFERADLLDVDFSQAEMENCTGIEITSQGQILAIGV